MARYRFGPSDIVLARPCGRIGRQLAASKFFASLDELKHKILANDMQLIEEAEEAAADAQSAARRYYTLFQELREQEALLDQWQRSHSPRT
ncbi:hypothetical protein PF002_g25279, partial [Phytophthora fragariae]